MKFIFFYSPLYNYYKDHIINNLNDIFDIEPILINDLSKNENAWHTFCGGVSIKIELIIQKIKENMGENIIFSDATIFINKKNKNEISDFFKNYINYDISFACNRGYGANYNIGIILMKCNEKLLEFFNTVLIELITNKSWDQSVVNNLIEKTDLSIGCFDNTKICCGDNFNIKYKEYFLIYKSFIPHTNNLIVNYNARFKKFLEAGLISLEEYNEAINYNNIDK